MPDHWQEFFLSILFHLAMPLMPLAIEYWITNDIRSETVILVASLYSLAIGASSRNKLFLGVSIVLAVMLAVAYGFTVGTNQPPPESKSLAYICIFSVFIWHVVERFNMHVLEKRKYWDF